MHVQPIRNRSHLGFSLIEVMIAVLVLAVGLLALVGLQANLVRGAADAKARSRIASLVSSKMDEARAGGYGNADLNKSGVPKVFRCPGDPDVCAAEIDAALTMGSLLVERRSPSVPLPTAPPAPNGAEYVTVTLDATWTDASGKPRSLSMVSAMSPLSLDGSNTLLNQQLSGDSSKSPVVRTDDPATAGVVPIALGNGSSSAASNPTPELEGRNNNEDIVATKFNVLTYVPAGASTVIQKRIETAVVKCSCQYGAGGTNLGEIYRTAQWPAIWTGERYDVFEPETVAAAPGQALSAGPKAGVVQSALCQECCRDHHDTAATGVAKFDPERTGSTSKYDLNGSGALEAVSNTNNGGYANACRIVRVDGFWRTASDLYSRQFGLLETESVANVKAKTGLPTTAATTAYTSFVKSYLQQYDGAVATAPAGAQAMFDATTGINDPTVVPIAAPSTTDYRYLHARGLYVDYLEEAARAKLVSVLDDTGTRGRCPTNTPLADCVLPYLPFTSANLTEIAKWLASDGTVLVVNSGNLLATNPGQPSGGRSYGKKVGLSDNTASVRNSNSGIAINSSLTSINGVDPADDTAVGSDLQPFEVGGTPGTGTGDDFFVNITGGGLNPQVFFTIGTDGGECVRLADLTRPCDTNSTLPLSGSVRIQNYGSEITVSRPTAQALGSVQCKYNGTAVSVETNGQNANIDVPAFRNYYVIAASIGGTAGTIGSSQNDGMTTETTSVAFASIPKGSTAQMTLSEQSGSPILAVLVSCTATTQGNKYYFGQGTWTKPWQ